MSASGYTPILIYASGTATNVPLAANLTSSASGAELALNYADGKLYYKNSSGVVTLLSASGGGPAGGSNTQVQFNSSGVLAGSSLFTWDGTTLVTPSHTTSTATTGSTNKGPLNYGTLSFSDTGIVQSAQTSVNSYFQNVMQNTSAGTAASAEFIAYNDQGTASTNYATVGINSSGYTGTGSINAPGYAYFLSASTDLVLGTIGANGIHFTTNSSATDALAISSAGAVSLPGGTANGVAYLNGSKVVTTGSALVFDGANLGIGTSSPAARLDLLGTASGASNNFRLTSYQFQNAFMLLNMPNNGTYTSFEFQEAGTTQGSLRRYGSAYGSGLSSAIQLANGSNTLTFDSSGNLGLGVTPSAWGNGGNIQLSGANVFANIGITYGANAYYNGGWKYITTGYGASYQNQVSGQHQFFTSTGTGTAGNAITFTQAMTLDASGNLLVGTTSQENSSKIAMTFTSANNGLALNETSNSSGTLFLFFRQSSATIGSVARVGTTSAVVFNTTSDYRLKTIVGTVTGQGERIDALKPVDYLWKEGGQQARGFLAHEFQTVYANSVTGDKDAVDADGNPVYQAMQAGSAEVIADLVAEVQSLRKRLAAAGI